MPLQLLWVKFHRIELQCPQRELRRHEHSNRNPRKAVDRKWNSKFPKWPWQFLHRPGRVLIHPEGLEGTRFQFPAKKRTKKREKVKTLTRVRPFAYKSMTIDEGFKLLSCRASIFQVHRIRHFCCSLLDGFPLGLRRGGIVCGRRTSQEIRQQETHPEGNVLTRVNTRIAALF